MFYTRTHTPHRTPHVHLVLPISCFDSALYILHFCVGALGLHTHTTPHLVRPTHHTRTSLLHTSHPAPRWSSPDVRYGGRGLHTQRPHPHTLSHLTPSPSAPANPPRPSRPSSLALARPRALSECWRHHWRARQWIQRDHRQQPGACLSAPGVDQPQSVLAGALIGEAGSQGCRSKPPARCS